MNIVFVCYKTDTQHSYASRDIIGIASNPLIAVDLCNQHATKSGLPITKDQLWNLLHLKQTQGYKGSGEYQFEELPVNVIF